MRVDLSNLGKSYDRNAWALRGLDLTIESGKILGLIGPNGAGKSTALRMMATLLEPSEGEVAFDGTRPRGEDEQRAVRRRIGFLGDGNPLYKDLTPREYLRFFGQCLGLSDAAIATATEDVLHLLALESKADARSGDLSKGMRQRLLIGRCLVHQPDLLILDEPADGLDPRGRNDLRRVLDGLRARGTTVVVSSHILRELDDLCDQVAVIQQGRLVVAGPVSEIIDRYEVGRFVYEMRVLPDGAEKAADALARHRVLVEATGTSDGLPSLSIQLQQDERCLPALLSDLLTNGVKVVTCSRLRSRLEDVYDRISDDRVN
jgi:ABC-2 type transport system ATP-binding protein